MAQIEIIGDDNYVLINDEYKNLILLDHGNLLFYKFDSSNATLGGYCSYSMPVDAGTMPLLAVSATFPVAYGTCTITNNIATWTFFCPSYGVGGVAKFYVFYLPEKAPDAGGLVKLWNAQGVLVFDSNLKYAKAETMLNFAFQQDTSVVLKPNRKYAVALVMGPREYSDLPVDAGGPGGFRMNRITKYSGVYVNGINVGSTTFEYYNLSYRTASPAGAYNVNENGAALIFDVTTLQV